MILEEGLKRLREDIIGYRSGCGSPGEPISGSGRLQAGSAAIE